MLGLLALACDAEPSDLREWKPSDHHHTTEPGRDQVDVSDPSSNPLAAHGVSEVVLLAWRQNCTRCHGAIGRGDGPQSAMFHPPDLTDPGLQSQLTDRDIMNVIQQGRGRMPRFDLPESTLTGLVRLIRLLDASGKGMNDTAGEAGATAATGASAPEPAAAGPDASASASAPPKPTAATQPQQPQQPPPAVSPPQPAPARPAGAGGTAPGMP